MNENLIAIWCLFGMAALAALTALAALLFRPSRMHMPRLRPSRLLRGCIVLTCLLMALTLGLIALLLVNRA
ncbi:MAG: hypothetical protein U0Z44_21395 [Kouleothrix sp.]